MEPLVLWGTLPGNPKELQKLVEDLQMFMKPDDEKRPAESNLYRYDEGKVIRILEKLYKLLIAPYVARFLQGMEYDHKLVICPSQVIL